MSADLHVVLNYIPVGSTLNAQLYNNQGIPNSSLVPPYIIVGTYTFFRDGVQIAQSVGVPTATVTVLPPACGTVFSVTVSYTAATPGGPAIPQTDSEASITVGSDYIYGDGAYITQSSIPGGIMLTLTPPVGLTPLNNIVWAKNYEILDPSPALSFIAPGNGIYEVAFQSSVTGLSYYGITEVTGSSPAQYVRTIGNDGNLYGTFGTPLSVDLLTFIPVGGNAPYRSRVYLNGVQYSDNNFINLQNLAAEDLIYYYSVDNCGIILSANTFLLPCGLLVPLIAKTTTPTVVQTAVEQYPRPTKDNRPPELPAPPAPQTVPLPHLPLLI